MDAVVRDAFDRVKARFNFAYDLKEEQVTVINTILDKKHAFVQLPTGYGKSDCFVVPPLILDEMCPASAPHISLIVSPLRSLMLNQVEKLKQRGISACAILKQSEMGEEVVRDLKEGKISVVFISPEAIQVDQWRSLLKRKHYRDRLCLVACDEAHCISQWGNDFRPTYKEVSILRSLTMETPFLLLTATCTAKMKTEILQSLFLEEDDVITVAFVPDRPNVKLNVTSTPGMKFETKMNWYVSKLKENGKNADKAIIYCRTINAVADIYEHIANEVENHGLVEMYHSAISKSTEEWVLTEFPKPTSDIRCLVSTIAFGMGVEISDVKIIIHWGTSKSILSFWQEVGRCARDQTMKGEAYLYAYPRSMIPQNTDKEMKEVVEKCVVGGECFRKNILSSLTVPGMDTSALEAFSHKESCDGQCGIGCTCQLCSCCTACESKCPCTVYKLGNLTTT